MKWSLALCLISCLLQFLWARQAATQQSSSTGVSKTTVNDDRYVELEDDAMQVNLEGDDIGDIPLEELRNTVVIPLPSDQPSNESAVATVPKPMTCGDATVLVLSLAIVLSTIGVFIWLFVWAASPHSDDTQDLTPYYPDDPYYNWTNGTGSNGTGWSVNDTSGLNGTNF